MQMSLQAMKQHGVFSWNELTTTDVPAAKAFYRDALGWDLNDIDSGMDYTMARVGDREVAGIMPLPEGAQGMPPAWGSYVTVDDVEKRVARVESLGGKVVVPPQDIPNIGRFAVISDPQGAMLALITYFDTE
jgi:predicted enzyme related to lactoylglutathione lyase